MVNADEDLPEVTVEEAMALVADGTILIDVREQDEWDAGHAPDARFLPLSQLQDRVHEIPDDQRVLIVCHSGGRSLRATSYLRAEGVDAVNVMGGMSAWAAAGGALSANAADA